MVLTVSFVLSPVTGLFCYRRRRNFRRLDTKRRGVRTTRLRRPPLAPFVNSAIHVHRIPARVDDVAQRPSVGQDGGSCKSDLPDAKSEIFFRRGLDRANHVDPSRQIPLRAHNGKRLYVHHLPAFSVFSVIEKAMW